MTTADPLNVDALAELVDAARAMANTFRLLCTAEMADKMTCTEAEAIADVLRTVDPELADSWIDGHAYGDEEPDDEHHPRWHTLQRIEPCDDDETPPPTR